MDAYDAGVMNDTLVTYPTGTWRDLSADARHLLAVAAGSSSGKFHRDPFAKGYHPYQDKMGLTERMRAAVDELEAIGVAKWREEYLSLSTTPIHTAYTIAQGRGSNFVRVYADDPDLYPRGILLAVALGGDIRPSDLWGRPGAELVVRHHTATDFEHDAAYTMRMSMWMIGSPELSDYGGAKVQGVVRDYYAYPMGVDPTKVEDDETPEKMCTSEHCETPHPFAPYLPPQLEALTGELVTIELRPMRPWRIAAPPAQA